MRYEHPTRWSRLLTGLTLVLALAGLSGLTGCGSEDSVSIPAITQPPPDDGGGSQPPPGTAPKPTIALDAPDPSAIVAGGSGSTIFATVRDSTGALRDGATVLLSSSIGAVGPVTALGNGRYRAVFTSTVAGTALVTARARVGSATSDPATAVVEIAPGPPARIVLTPSRNQIPPDDVTVSEIALRVEDALGNPVPGTVSLSVTLGTITPEEAALSTGSGTAEFRSAVIGVSRVTAQLQGAPAITASTDIAVVASEEGVPAIVQIAVEPVRIFVSGVGRDERAFIAVAVTDRFGTPIADVPNNIEVELLRTPGGGENLGRDPATGAPLTRAALSTLGGVATVVLNSGTVPGTLQLEARVVRGAAGEVLPTPLSARAPEISIVSGPPFSLVFGRGAPVVNAATGTSTRSYSAVVSDVYGNAVPNDTAVFFGQIANEKAQGLDGQALSAAPRRFRSASANFVASDIRRGDTLILLSDPKGGYVVDSVVDGQTLELTTPLPILADAAALEFVVGDNTGGGVFSGSATTVGGVAVSTNTYLTANADENVWVYAETSGRAVGDAFETTPGGGGP